LLDRVNETKNLEKAIQSYSKAINLNPNSSSAYHSRGFCNFQFKKYSEALRDYNNSIRINPNSPHPYYLLGILYSELN